MNTEVTNPEEKLRTLTSDIQPIVDEYADLLEILNNSTSCRVNLGTLRASTAEDGIACTDTSVFVPRPPLVFGAWLKTLRLRAEVNQPMRIKA